MKLLVILIPVFNNIDGLRKSIYSLNCSKIDFDIVIVDDGSVDPIKIDELSKISKNKIILIRNSENQGIEKSLNLGLQYVLKEGYMYIARLDAGDLIVPHRFENQINAFENDQRIGIVGSNTAFIDPNTGIKFSLNLPQTDDAISLYARKKPPFVHASVMIKSEVFRAVGLYDVRYQSAEDYELFYRILKKGYLGCNLQEVLTICDFNPSGITVKRRRRQLLSILMTQMKYNPKNLNSLIYIIRTIILFFVPFNIIRYLHLKNFLNS